MKSLTIRAAVVVSAAVGALCPTAASVPVSASVSSSVSASASASSAAEDTTKILFLLDVSGSMNERLPSGGTKLAAAKQAVKDGAGSLPAGTEVGLRVYGSRISQPRQQNPRACQDTELVLPVGPLDQDRLDRAVDSFRAVGETPIAYSMTKAVEDLGPSGRRVVVLVSDGEENCVPDPCPTVAKLAGSGVDLQFDAVGFDVSAAARAQLRCIAGAGGGSYYDAGRADELTESLQKITARALRPFRMTGERVAGTADAATAPTLGDGQYVDSFPQSTTERYYRIDRRPGDAVSVSLTDVNAPLSDSGSMTSYNVYLNAPDGTTCDTVLGGSTSYTSAKVTSLAVGAPAPDGSAGTPASGPCADGPLVLLVKPSRFLESQPFRIELRVSSTPPAENLADLPGPSTVGSDDAPVAPREPAGRVVGGSSFLDAAEVGEGSFTDSIAVGETVFYKVPLTYGQRLKVTAELPRPGSPWSPGPADGFYPAVAVYSPDRAALDTQSQTVTGLSGAQATFTSQTAEVRFRNRESSEAPVRWASRDGDYFVAVSLGANQQSLTGRLMQIRLDVHIEGSPSGAPRFETASSPSPSASSRGTGAARPAGDSAAGGVSWPVVGGLLAVVLVVAGAAGVLLGRRRR